MYSNNEIIDAIKLSAQRRVLNQLFIAAMSEKNQKLVTIQDMSHANLADILNQLDDHDILITNDNYISEKCDFLVIDKNGEILLTVNEDGSVINKLDQIEYLEESMCNKLAKILNTIIHSDNVCIVTYNAA